MIPGHEKKRLGGTVVGCWGADGEGQDMGGRWVGVQEGSDAGRRGTTTKTQKRGYMAYDYLSIHQIKRKIIDNRNMTNEAD